MVSVAMEGLDKEKECDREVTGHVLACALTAIGEMAPSIGTPCASILDALAQPMFAAILHPALHVRLASAAGLRALAVVMPSKASHLADQVSPFSCFIASLFSPYEVPGAREQIPRLAGWFARSINGLGRHYCRQCPEPARSTAQYA